MPKGIFTRTDVLRAALYAGKMLLSENNVFHYWYSPASGWVWGSCWNDPPCCEFEYRSVEEFLRCNQDVKIAA